MVGREKQLSVLLEHTNLMYQDRKHTQHLNLSYFNKSLLRPDAKPPII